MKRGRPKNKELRTNIINTRLNDSEYEKVKAKANKAGTSIGELLRDSLLDVEIQERPIQEGAEILRLVQNIAGNLNQITRKVNRDVPINYFDKKIIDEIVHTLKDLKSKI